MNERNERKERTERTERTEWTERTERSQRTEWIEKIGRTEKTGINLPAEGGRVCENLGSFSLTLPTSAGRLIILVHPPRMQDE